MAEREDTCVPARPDAPAAWRTSGRDTQVFVDDSGRRALGVRAIGLALAAVWAFWLAGLAVGMAGYSDFPTTVLPRLAIAHTSGGPLGRAQSVADRSGADARDAAALRAERLDAVGTPQAASARTSAPCPASAPAPHPSSASGQWLRRHRRNRAGQAAAGGGVQRPACRPPVTVRNGATSRLT